MTSVIFCLPSDFLCDLDALVEGLKKIEDIKSKLHCVDWANGAMRLGAMGVGIEICSAGYAVESC